MSSQMDRPPLRFEVRLPANHPHLLEGLDLWLELGLISDAQVRQICREYLVCKLVVQPLVEPQPQVKVAPRVAEKGLIAYLPVEPKIPVTPKVTQPNFVTSILQSLGEELSVRWLLFLGVFLVVLSSGVLAASQWERFPAAGQYGVLLAYTLCFGGFTVWSGKQSNLRLTAQTLLTVTLLLVPVNFWAMDGFNLWGNPINWVMVAIASLVLSSVTIFLCQNRQIIPNFPSGKLPLINILGLSFLHWGWNIPGFPVIAIYLATIGTTLITFYKNGYISQTPVNSEQNTKQNTNTETQGWQGNLFFAVIIYALLSLLFRAVFVVGIDITQLGLAVGISGWLVSWLAGGREEAEGQRGRGAEGQEAGGRRQEAEGQGGKGAEGNEERRVSSSSASSPSSSSSSAIWEALGGVLLLLGWLVTVRTQPGQAIVISGLGLQFFYRRLERYSLNSDFTVIFLTGLQAIWLGWRLVPGAFQELAVITATAWTNSQNEPWTLLGVALFPYIALMLTFTGWLYRREKRELASFGEQLTLILGVILTIIALNNPILRSLNLFLSSVSLLVVCKRRASSPDALVYLTHITGLVTVCSFINWFFPDLPREVWASILLVLMVGEWLFSLGQGIWQRSAWYIGVGLASLSFIPLWVNTETYWTLSNIAQQNSWCAVWLITPVTLTFLVSRTSERQRQDNLILSLVTVIVAQLLTLPLPTTRVIGLAVGLIVMFINTYYLQIEANAGFTVGFGLSLIAAILWQFFPNLTVAGWLIVCAVATFSLWIGKKILLQREQELTNLYAGVSDKWAIALCGVELLGMTLHSAQVYQGYAPAGIFYIVATTITLSAIIYRTWGRASDIAFYGVGWCLELLTAEILGFGESSIIKVAIANIGLGLTTQLFGEWWRKRFQVNNLPDSLHILPLIYGAFSLLFRINDFTSWTGLCSLGVALIFVGVGRRRTEFKPLVYLGIIGISLSAYELLFYQMSQARGGVIGDGLIAMSALGAGIMFAYRRLTPILVNYFNLTRAELKAIAHFHWGVSSLLFIAALTAPVQINLWLGFGTGLFLARYAIFEGRRQTNDDTPATTNWGITHNEIWVYLGLIEAVMLAIYLEKLPSVDRVFQQIIPWESAIASIIAYFLYILPWQKWRWSKTPWQNVAYILPLISVWQTQTEIYPITLIFTAVYYAFLAKFAANLRFTYISLGLIDWALFRWLDSLRLTDSIWYVTIIGLSLLYIAQIDPQLQQYQSKEPRHVLRMTASGAICGWAVLYYQNLPLIPGIFSLITIFAGLGLKVRAYLYVGSAAFFATSIYQMVIFSLNYSFLKWIIGLLVGILLIYIAANFETRRAQINTLLRNISEELTNWQ